jgi:hypothetical protein
VRGQLRLAARELFEIGYILLLPLLSLPLLLLPLLPLPLLPPLPPLPPLPLLPLLPLLQLLPLLRFASQEPGPKTSGAQLLIHHPLGGHNRTTSLPFRAVPPPASPTCPCTCPCLSPCRCPLHLSLQSTPPPGWRTSATA